MNSLSPRRSKPSRALGCLDELPGPAAVAGAGALELLLDAEATCLRASGAAPVRIAPGIEQVVQLHLARPTPLAYSIETAIAAIEDELAQVPGELHRRALFSRSAQFAAMARAAGLGSSGLPQASGFIAGLLLTRELMHHLDVESIAWRN